MTGLNVCVTGANGFIGRRLIRSLAQQGHNITALSRKNNSVFSGRVNWIKGDLTSDDCPLEKFLDRCDVIFHCAGEVHDTKVMGALHVDGTQRLIKAVLKKAEQRKAPIHWVQLSSVGVYGPPQNQANEARVVTEISPVRPKGKYEQTKAQADELVIQAAKNPLMTYTIIRPSNVFGADMPNGALWSLAEAVRKGMFFYIGRLPSIATYVHVDDVVNLLVYCIDAAEAKGDIFNISNDCLLEELIEGLADSLKVKRPWLRFPELIIRIAVQVISHIVALPLTQERVNVLVSRTRYSTSKLQNKLGFIVKTSVPKKISTVAIAE